MFMDILRGLLVATFFIYAGIACVSLPAIELATRATTPAMTAFMAVMAAGGAVFAFVGVFVGWLLAVENCED